MARDRNALEQEVRTWIENDPDPETQSELTQLLENQDWTALEERFNGPLEFGTAGLRGLVGGGPSRMNRLTVAQASAALARQLMADVVDAAQRGVVVARDGRNMSPEFAKVTAEVFLGYGLNVYFMDEPTPTPIAAFAGRKLNTAATVVVTASHNPPAYNGYKVYSEQHHQIVSPQDGRIRIERKRLGSPRSLARLELSEGRAQGMLRVVPESVLDAYFTEIDAQCMGTNPPEAQVRIVTTALHGVGHQYVERALQQRGFRELFPVLEQSLPDGAFPTVVFPNPEEDGALDLAMALGRKVGADLLIANDPDTDRLACGIFLEDSVRLFSGNELGVLLADWLLSQARAHGTLPRRSAVLSTIVSTQMLDAVGTEYGAECHRTLTGFKFIWERALSLAQDGIDFRFGFEEALGYCVGKAVRDKDGISAALIAAELTAHLKARGLTLLDRLEELWGRHGFYATSQVATTMEGLAGRETIERIMNRLRSDSTDVIAGSRVVTFVDLEKGAGTLGPANVLQWDLDDGSRVIFRPSGTEPKLKAYLETRSDVDRVGLNEARLQATQRLSELRTWVTQTVETFGSS
jgi:phosphomannomutase